MDQLFTNGRIVEIIIAFMALEAIALVAYRKVFARGLGTSDIASVLIPGLCLLLALRAALLEASWHVIAGWLLAALIAHLGDLWRRQS
jgi:hypothetical protein